MICLSHSVLREILRHYAIGELLAFERNERGFVNTGYALETRLHGEQRKYFLRRYKAGIRAEEILFEHSIINHLTAQGFSPVARVVPTKIGATFCRRLEEGGEVFYAIFDFLTGEDKYSWVNPQCTEQEVTEAAVVLAEFHTAVSDCTPQGQRAEAKISELLPQIARNVNQALKRGKNTDFDACLTENAPLIMERLTHTFETLQKPTCRALPQLVIHCDYHPGNLKFQNGRVVGLFDFDWAKVDYRCFDVALALWYFFTAWGERDGELRGEQVSRFLDAYQQALAGKGGVGPLTPEELTYLPAMFHAANLYVLNWTISDYYQKTVNPQEYLGYLRHSVNTIRLSSEYGMGEGRGVRTTIP